MKGHVGPLVDVCAPTSATLVNHDLLSRIPGALKKNMSLHYGRILNITLESK